eukprot:350914_1
MALLPLFLTFIVVSGQYSWTKHSSPPLPVRNRVYSVGVYNETIFLVGGGAEIGLVSFDVIDETIANLGTSNIQTSWGYGDYYAQIGHTVYYIYPNSPRLNKFDMRLLKTTSFLSTPWDVDYSGCLAADVPNNRLFVVGGGFNTALNNVTFLNLATSDWTTAPVMNWARREHSCIVDPVTSKLFVIGSKETGTIEYIDVNTLDQWRYNDEALPSKFYTSRAVIHPWTALIYLIGGRNACSSCSVKYFFTIDPITGKVTKISISYALEYGMGVAVFGDTIYSFGGGSMGSTAWFKMKLQSSDPTMATNDPSTSPSGAPSNPSANPSSNPTKNPTANPSNIPSKQSSNPTGTPTANPSSNPSSNP